MGKIKLILGASILLLVSVQVNGALINFDDLSAGTFLTDQYASNGIIFDGTWIHDGLSPPRGSVPNWISGEEVTNNNSNPGAISGYFVNPGDLSQNAITDYFEILSAYVDSDTTVTLEVFDLDGLPLGSRSRTGSSGILSLSVTNIHSFSLSHINNGWNGIDDIIGFDNASFSLPTSCSEFPGGGNTGGCFPGPGPFPGKVPTPAVIWLFGIGMIGLGFARRKQRSGVPGTN